MAKDIIAASFDFVGEHILDIILVVLLLFCLIIYIVSNNVKFIKSHPKLQRVVVVENLENKTSDKISEIESGVEAKAKAQTAKTSNSKMNVCIGSIQDKDKACAEIGTKKTCGSMNCCVWARKNKTFSCVGGDAGGVTYDDHDYDAYYYQNKRYPQKDIKKTTKN